jgi:hypothetical protein
MASGIGSIPLKSGEKFRDFVTEGGVDMDTTTIIRVVAAVLFVIVLVIYIQRRRSRVK